MAGEPIKQSDAFHSKLNLSRSLRMAPLRFAKILYTMMHNIQTYIIRTIQTYRSDGKSRLLLYVHTYSYTYRYRQKLPKPNTLALTFSNMILSQSNGVVLNSTHELYSCKANCISGGSYFRITIALNYSTWLLVIQTGVWSQILLLPLLDLH